MSAAEDGPIKGLTFDVEGVTVFFPYEFVYPEQYAYMLEIKRALDAKGHALLEVRFRRSHRHRAHRKRRMRAENWREICGKTAWRAMGERASMLRAARRC